eukprot:8208028-Alexandrium_andersonii.AAC.1
MCVQPATARCSPCKRAEWQRALSEAQLCTTSTHEGRARAAYYVWHHVVRVWMRALSLSLALQAQTLRKHA